MCCSAIVCMRLTSNGLYITRCFLFGLEHVSALQISAPLAVIGGHSKAVSYVRWVGSNQVISASTDNHLKLWDVAEAASSEGNCAPITSFTGEGCLLAVVAPDHLAG